MAICSLNPPGNLAIVSASPLLLEAQDRRFRCTRQSAAAACTPDRFGRRRTDLVRRAGTSACDPAAAKCCAGADPEDLNPPERSGQGIIDLTELETRVVRAENALNAAHKALNALITKIATTTAEALRTALLKLGTFGVGPAVPVSAAGEDPAAIATLARQGQALLKISGPRLDQGAALRVLPVATEQRARRDQLVERSARRVRAIVRGAAALFIRFRRRH